MCHIYLMRGFPQNLHLVIVLVILYRHCECLFFYSKDKAVINLMSISFVVVILLL